MDLQAANDANTGAWRFTRFGMIACFVLAGLMLVASLTMANSHAAINSAAPSSHAPSS
jgi:hypothetical protein